MIVLDTGTSSTGITELTQAVTALVAVAAFGLSLYNLVIQRRNSIPSLEVVYRFGVQPYGGPLMVFEARNTGSINVFVQSLYIPVSGDQNLFLPSLDGEKKLPCKLEPGEAATFWHPLVPVYDRLRELGYQGKNNLTLVAKDSLDNTYKTTVFVDLDNHYDE